MSSPEQFSAFDLQKLKTHSTFDGENNPESSDLEFYRKTWQSVYDLWRQNARTRNVEMPEIVVPSPNISLDELNEQAVDVEGNRIPTLMMYFPSEFQGKSGLVALGGIFPELHSRTIKATTPLENVQEFSGWLNVEAVPEAPYADTDEAQLREHLDRMGRHGMNENQYILLAYFMKATTGHFIDSRILCRLLGSQMDGYVVNSRFGPNGDLHVNSHLRPSLRGWELGGRSVKIVD